MSEIKFQEAESNHELAYTPEQVVEFSIDKTKLSGYVMTITDFRHTDGKMRTLENLTEHDLKQLHDEIENKVSIHTRIVVWYKNFKIGRKILNISLWR